MGDLCLLQRKSSDLLIFASNSSLDEPGSERAVLCNIYCDPFWQQNNQPVELQSNKFIDQKLNYIHNNPVEAGIVLSPEEYLYSSAINYANRPEKLLDVIVI
jgi:hypothetical protein